MADDEKSVWAEEEWHHYRKDNFEGYLTWYWNSGLELEKWSRWLRRASIWLGLLATSAAAFPATDFNSHP